MKNKKLKFYFTEGHTHTVTGVTGHNVNPGNVFIYHTSKVSNDIWTESKVQLPMKDVLYVECIEGDHVQIIPGLVRNFSVTPDPKEIEKINEQVLKAKQEEEKYAKHKEEKKRKNAQRKKEQYAKQLGVSVEQLGTLHKK